MPQRPKVESAQTKNLQAIWLQALEDTVVIPCDGKATAIRLRFLLYGAVRYVRMNPEFNPKLAEAADSVQVSTVETKTGWHVRVGKSAAMQAVAKAIAKLGLDVDAVPVTQDQVDLEAQAVLENLAKAGMVERREEPQSATGQIAVPSGSLDSPPNPYIDKGWRK